MYLESIRKEENKKLFKEIKTPNFTKLMKTINPHIQKTEHTPITKKTPDDFLMKFDEGYETTNQRKSSHQESTKIYYN